MSELGVPQIAHPYVAHLKLALTFLLDRLLLRLNLVENMAELLKLLFQLMRLIVENMAELLKLLFQLMRFS